MNYEDKQLDTEQDLLLELEALHDEGFPHSWRKLDQELAILKARGYEAPDYFLTNCASRKFLQWREEENAFGCDRESDYQVSTML